MLSLFKDGLEDLTPGHCHLMVYYSLFYLRFGNLFCCPFSLLPFDCSLFLTSRVYQVLASKSVFTSWIRNP